MQSQRDTFVSVSSGERRRPRWVYDRRRRFDTGAGLGCRLPYNSSVTCDSGPHPTSFTYFMNLIIVAPHTFAASLLQLSLFSTLFVLIVVLFLV